MENFIFQNPVKANHGAWDDCPAELKKYRPTNVL